MELNVINFGSSVELVFDARDERGVQAVGRSQDQAAIAARNRSINCILDPLKFRIGRLLSTRSRDHYCQGGARHLVSPFARFRSGAERTIQHSTLRRQRFCADVATIVFAFELDLVGGFVRLVERFFECRADCRNAKYTPTGSDQRSTYEVEHSATVEYDYTLDFFRIFYTRDG